PGRAHPGEPLERLRPGEHAPARKLAPCRGPPVAPRREGVVERERGPEDGRTPEPPAVQGHQAGERPDPVREGPEEPGALRHRLPEPGEVQALQIAEPAVDDPEVVGAGFASDLATLQEEGVE